MHVSVHDRMPTPVGTHLIRAAALVCHVSRAFILLVSTFSKKFPSVTGDVRMLRPTCFAFLRATSWLDDASNFSCQTDIVCVVFAEGCKHNKAQWTLDF